MDQEVFEKLRALSGDPIAFEVERQNIIRSYMRGLPLEERVKAEVLQHSIDAIRKSLTSEQYMAWLCKKINELQGSLLDECMKLSAELETIKRGL